MRQIPWETAGTGFLPAGVRILPRLEDLPWLPDVAEES
jgi:hypothetical protein